MPAYQPETAYQIFMRALSSVDIASGKTSTANSVYTTTGPSSTWAIKNQVPSSPAPVCYIWSPSSCTDEQTTALQNGTAIVQDYVVVGIVGHETASS